MHGCRIKHFRHDNLFARASLDTHILLWWINGAVGKLPESMVATIEDSESVAVSAISCFEIEWLARHGRIELEISLDDWFSSVFFEAGVNCIPITAEVARLAASLPEHHPPPPAVTPASS